MFQHYTKNESQLLGLPAFEFDRWVIRECNNKTLFTIVAIDRIHECPPLALRGCVEGS